MPGYPKIAVNVSASGDTTLIAAPANIGGQPARIRVIGFFLQAAGTVNAKFYSGTSATGMALTGPMPMSATGPPIQGQPFHPTAHGPEGHFETNPGDPLTLNLSGAVAVTGWLVYQRVAA
jgi:hypothetical protein